MVISNWPDKSVPNSDNLENFTITEIKEKSEYKEKLVAINRITKVVKAEEDLVLQRL